VTLDGRARYFSTATNTYDLHWGGRNFHSSSCLHTLKVFPLSPTANIDLKVRSLTFLRFIYYYYYHTRRYRNLYVPIIWMRNITCTALVKKNPNFKSKSKSKLTYYDWQSVGQSILVSGTHLGPATNFSHPLFDFFLYSLGLVDMGRPLWREVGSVRFSFCLSSPAQPFSDESHGTYELSLLSLFLRHPQPGGRGSCIYFPQKQGIYINILLILDGPHRKHKHRRAHADAEGQITSWPVFITRKDRKGTSTLGQQSDPNSLIVSPFFRNNDGRLTTCESIWHVHFYLWNCTVLSLLRSKFYIIDISIIYED
jgi:hypothetical protein